MGKSKMVGIDMLVSKMIKVTRPNFTWEPPLIDSVKVNVDGAAPSETGKANIGGLLRDVDGRIKALFYKSIGIYDSNLVEILTIRKTFFIFAAS